MKQRFTVSARRRVGPEGHERRLRPFGQAGRTIVVAHVIKDIGHCEVPLSLQAVGADLAYKLRRKSIMAALTSGARSCWVQ